MQLCDPVPVFVADAHFLDGGLLLALHLHHCVGDGSCMSQIISRIAGASRGEKHPHRATLLRMESLEQTISVENKGQYSRNCAQTTSNSNSISRPL
jgi:hypothetical protein